VGVRKRKPPIKAPPRPKPARPRRPKAAVGLAALDDSGESSIKYGAASLHDLFQQQVRTVLDRTDLDEEQKQGVLIAASCPCCGAGGMSFTVKLSRRK
jgi:hypothetical protein